MNNNDFSVMLKAVLDKSGIQTELKQVQQIVSKYSIDVLPELKTASLRNQLKSVSKEMADDFNKTFGTNVKGNDIYKAYINQIKQAENAIKQEQKAQENLVNAMARGREQSEKAYQAEKKRQDLAQNNATNKALEQEYQQIQKINKALNENKVSSDMNGKTGVTTKYKTLSSVPESLQTDYVKLKSLSEQLNTSLDDTTKIKVWNEYKTTLTSVNNQMDKVLATSGRLATESQKITTLASLKNYLSKNSGIDDASKSKINGWIHELTSGMDVAESRTKDMTSSLKLLDAEQREAGKVGLSFTDSIKEQAKTFTQWITVSGIVMSAVQTFRSMIQTVSELDKSLVDLQMATGDTHAQAQQLLSTYIQMGKQLGATGTEVADAASSWLKQGKSIADTNTLIKDSIMLSKLGSIESADATKYLTTITKTYGIAANDTLTVVDKLSKVDLESATDVGGLAQGLNEVSANAKSLGVNLDELIGYVAAIGETSGEQMSAVGTALNAMFSRMSNIKLKRLVDPETNEDLSNTETSLRRVGIQLRSDEGNFRNLSDVLKDVASKWSGYNDVTKQSIAASIAGVNHMNDFKILMQQFGKATEYAADSQNSAGSAMVKFSAYEEGVEAKTKRVQASLQELATDTLNSGVVKGFLDAGNGIVNFVDKTGVLQTAIVGIITAVSVKKGISLFNNSEIANVTRLSKEIKNLTIVESIEKLMAEGVGKAEIEAALLRNNYEAATIKSTMANYTFAASEDVATASTVGLGNALKALVIAHPILAAIAAIGTVAFAGYQIWDAYTVSFDEAMDSMAKSKEEFDNSKTEIDSLNSQLDTCKSKLKELQDLAKNGKLTIADEKQIDTLQKTNDQLERQLAIQKEKQLLSAKTEIKSAKEAVEAGVTSQYEQKSSGTSKGYNTFNGYKTVAPQEELANATKAYDDYAEKIKQAQIEQAKITGDTDEAKDKIAKYDKVIEGLTEQQTKAEQRASDMSDTISKLVSAYDDEIAVKGNS